MRSASFFNKVFMTIEEKLKIAEEYKEFWRKSKPYDFENMSDEEFENIRLRWEKCKNSANSTGEEGLKEDAPEEEGPKEDAPKYRALSFAVTGRTGKIAKSGDILDEDFFISDNIELLLNQKHIEIYNG